MDIPLSIFLVFCGVEAKPVLITFKKPEAKAYKCAAKRIMDEDPLPFLVHQHKEHKAHMDEIIRQYLEWHEEVR